MEAEDVQRLINEALAVQSERHQEELLALVPRPSNEQGEELIRRHHELRAILSVRHLELNRAITAINDIVKQLNSVYFSYLKLLNEEKNTKLLKLLCLYSTGLGKTTNANINCNKNNKIKKCSR